jgi:hypothetical protein
MQEFVTTLWAKKWFPFALIGAAAAVLYSLGFGDLDAPGRGTALIWALIGVVAVYGGVPALLRSGRVRRR